MYPELVIRDGAGQIQGVRYEELAPMLLNEVQQQALELRDVQQQLAKMQVALALIQAKDGRVTKR